jgi:hypothetical protein
MDSLDLNAFQTAQTLAPELSVEGKALADTSFRRALLNAGILVVEPKATFSSVAPWDQPSTQSFTTRTAQCSSLALIGRRR